MKAFNILFLAVLFLILQSMPALAATEVYLEPEYNAVEEGNDYTVEVKINTDEQVLAYELKIGYNQDILNVTDVNKGDFLGATNTFFIDPVEYDLIKNGTVTIAETRFSGTSTGSGTLATILFHAKSDGDPEILFEDVIILDENMNEISLNEEPPEESNTPDGGGSPGGGSDGGSFFPPTECTPNWNCTEWSPCSGGLQTRTCTDLNNCKADVEEDQPCGGEAYHGAFPSSEVYTQQSGSNACTEGLRVCGSGGVVECRSGRLVKITDCEFGCEKGICLTQEGKPMTITGQIVFDPAVVMYGIFIVIVVIFGVAIAFYGLK